MPEPSSSESLGLNRRQWLEGAVALGATASLVTPGITLAAEGKAVTRGRIKQSIVFWCFNIAGEKWDIDKTCQVAKSLGCLSVEIVGPEMWPTLKPTT